MEARVDPSLLLHFDSLLTKDSSLSNNTITVFGDPAISGASPKFGAGSASFVGGGNGDYLLVSGPAQNMPANGDFCVEMFFRTTSQRNFATLISKNNGGFGPGSWTILLTSNGFPRIYWSDASTGSPVLNSSTGGANDGAWHHLAWVRRGVFMHLYLDGLQVASLYIETIFTQVDAPLSIGNDLVFAPRGFIGNLDELRITLGDSVYDGRGTIIVPTAPFPDPEGAATPLSGSLIATEAGDSMVATGAREVEHTASMVASESPDAMAGSGSTVIAYRGSANMVEALDTFWASASREYTIASSMSVAEESDTLEASAGVFIQERAVVMGRLPAITGRASASIGAVVRATLPMIAARAVGGGWASGRLPALRGSASGTNPQSLTVNAALPAIRGSATISTPNVIRIQGRLPSIVGKASGGAVVAGKLPMLSGRASASNESSIRVSGKLPAIRGSASASSEPQGAVVRAVLPMLVAGSSARAAIVLPRLVGRGLISNWPEVAFQTFAINLQHKVDQVPQPVFVNEVTAYQGFANARQIVRHGDKHFVITDTAIYEHTGDTDDGQPIAWEMQTAFSDLGSRNKKQVRYMYLAARIGGGFTGQIIPGDDDQQNQPNSSPRSQKPQNGRILGGRGTRSRYYGFGVANALGERIDIDAIDIEFDVTGRGL